MCVGMINCAGRVVSGAMGHSVGNRTQSAGLGRARDHKTTGRSSGDIYMQPFPYGMTSDTILSAEKDYCCLYSFDKEFYMCEWSLGPDNGTPPHYQSSISTLASSMYTFF